MAQVGQLFEGSSVNRRIFRAAAAVTAAGIVVKLVATLKEVVLAGVYGRSDAMEAFLAAALIPSLLINLVSESMNQSLVPTLVRVRSHQGHEKAQQLLSNSMLCLCLLLGAVSVAAGLGAKGIFPLIASHFSPEKLALSIRIFYAMLPVVLLTGVASNCTAVLNTFDRFALPALAPMAISLAIIVGTLALGGRLGIWALVYSTLAGSLVHACVVAWMMNAHGYKFRVALAWNDGGDARGGGAVWAGAAGRDFGIGWLAGGPVDGGVCSPREAWRRWCMRTDL